MDSQKKQVADKLIEAKNVLVTVSANPSVDQLAACLGLTLTLNKLGKHATAVFSGKPPSTIDFLKPEATLEANTNSLRDFIIALDKAKADKLRYKVEDKVVRIFITPYKTSIGEDDLKFSEGDFNVDAVVALGVKQQQDLDEAVTANGNILHDATVITMTTSDESGLGSIHWRDPEACGVSELAASLADSFEKDVLDEQIATAYLTGIVAQTKRFSNSLTTSNTMKIASQLMGAGADQQLVAAKLEKPAEPSDGGVDESENSEADLKKDEKNDQLPEPKPESKSEQKPSSESPKEDPGLLEITHHKVDSNEVDKNSADADKPDSAESDSGSTNTKNSDTKEEKTAGSDGGDGGKISDQQKDKSGTSRAHNVLRGAGPDVAPLTANSQEEQLDPSVDPLGLPPLDLPALDHNTDKGKNDEAEPKDRQDKADKDTKPGPKNEEATNELPKLASFDSESKPKAPLANNDQTLNDIQNRVHENQSGQTPATQNGSDSDDSGAASKLPSVNVNASGELVKDSADDKSPRLKPAPGFESTDPNVDQSPSSMAPGPVASPDERKKDDGNSPPPVPPPMIPPSS